MQRRLLAALLFLVCLAAAAEEPLFQASALTPAGQFTGGIEGPACDAQGNIYCVKFGNEHTLGKTTPEGKAALFVDLPKTTKANGIRFGPDGMMYVADYTGHHVLRVNPKTREITTFAHEATMNQPNDLCMAADGTMYASDPNWKESRGQLWRVSRDGQITRAASDMGTTNGIDLSPDGKVLYVNESVQRQVWAFDVQADGSLSGKRLVKEFPDFGFDGMRVDVDGNLYITRHGKGTVVKLSPKGEILQEITLPGKNPSNLCFGGPDGRTIYVTEMEHGQLVQFRVDRPGLEWQRLKEWGLK